MFKTTSNLRITSCRVRGFSGFLLQSNRPYIAAYFLISSIRRGSVSGISITNSRSLHIFFFVFWGFGSSWGKCFISFSAATESFCTWTSKRTGVSWTGDVTDDGLDPAEAGGQALWGEKDLDAVDVTGAAGAGEGGKTILEKVLLWWMGLALGAEAVEPQLLSGAPGEGLYIGLLSGDATGLGKVTLEIWGGMFKSRWLQVMKGFSVGQRFGTMGIWKRAGLLTHSCKAFCRRRTWSGLEAMPTRAMISRNSSSPASHSCWTSSPPGEKEMLTRNSYIQATWLCYMKAFLEVDITSCYN